MNIRLANSQDLDTILQIYADARSFMKESGNPNQWGTVNPPVTRTIEDFETHKLHVVCEGEEILGVFFFDIADDPTYSIIYNGTYMIPEIIITAIAAALIVRIPQIKIRDEI